MLNINEIKNCNSKDTKDTSMIKNMNRTLKINDCDIPLLKKHITTLDSLKATGDFLDKTINANLFDALPILPNKFADLIIADPPYNMDKDFGDINFTKKTKDDYKAYIMSWLPLVCKKLKDNGSLYLCGDWKTSYILQECLTECLTVINRITWQREKGRGAKANWKNSMEDIWFSVKNKNDYYFDIEAVKIKRKVLAPYKENGEPKDWQKEKEGSFRLTCPSNFWDDITVPFWSMKENTDHPTQKAEKLYAKLILASCKKEGIVFDPFLGSGTAAVVAKKLGRHYCGVEINTQYCYYAAKRLLWAKNDKTIQGFCDGVFWERNTLKEQNKNKTRKDIAEDSTKLTLFV